MVSNEVKCQGSVTDVPTNGTDFPFFPRKPGFQAILIRIFSISSYNQEVDFTSQKTRALCGTVIKARNTNAACQLTIA
jgi:hypothetical protein